MKDQPEAPDQPRKLPRLRLTALRPHAPSAALSLASALLLWLAFPLVDFGWTAWVALVPWLIMIGRATSGRQVAFWSAVAGCAFFVPALHWIRFTTGAGWIVLALYCAAYWPVAGLLIRRMRRRGLPLALIVPLVVTVLEFARSRLVTGFPFLFLGHTQYRCLPVIQIADLAGVYGITFLIAAVNGTLADFVLGACRLTRRTVVTCAVTLVLLLATVGYGVMRIRGVDPTPGPKVCLVQANVPLSLKHSPSYDELLEVLKRHVELSRDAAGQDVDLILWPETMVPAPINQMDPNILRLWRRDADAKNREYGDFIAACKREITRALQLTNTRLLAGAETLRPQPRRRYNSAYYLAPDGTVLGRYDKIHLVVFGEYTPLAGTFPFLKKLRPAAMGSDLSPGGLRTLFDLPYGADDEARFGVTICYEDAEAPLFRQFVDKGAQFMVNLTNDGWFRDSSELDIHLAVCVFRAVENRVCIARCANTGISAIIEPHGAIRRRIALPDGRYREVKGTLIDTISLTPQRSFYTAHGDLFAWLCVLAAVVALLAPRLPRPRPRPEPDPPPAKKPRNPSRRRKRASR